MWIREELGQNWGFPGSSAGKESFWNAGDPGSIPGSERSRGDRGWGGSPRKGIGYLLQISWASLMAHIVKNLPPAWETWIQSLGWEDPLEEGVATHSSILAWRIPMDRGSWQATVHGIDKSWTWLSNFHFSSTQVHIICWQDIQEERNLSSVMTRMSLHLPVHLSISVLGGRYLSGCVIGSVTMLPIS